MKKRAGTVGLVVWGCLGMAAMAGMVASGAIDPSFGRDGRAFVSLNRDAFPSAVAVQPDGRIVVAGATKSPRGHMQVAVARLTRDGEVDSAFGADGAATANWPADRRSRCACLESLASRLVVQVRGRLAIAGTVRSGAGGRTDPRRVHIGLLAYTRAGALDRSFGRQGKVVLPTTSHVVGDAIAVPGGRLVIAGDTTRGVTLFRLNRDGSPDRHFGTRGRVVTRIPGPPDVIPRAVQRRRDGKLVVAATEGAADSAAAQVTIIRYRSNGRLDKSFGSGGIANASAATPGLGSGLGAVLWLRSGKLLVVGADEPIGAGNSTLYGRLALARFTSSGHPDLTFGQGGRVVRRFHGKLGLASINAVEETGNARLVVGVSLEDPAENERFALIRFLHDGHPDDGFGARGVVVEPQLRPGYREVFGSMALDSRGRIVVGGASERRSGFVVRRIFG